MEVFKQKHKFVFKRTPPAEVLDEIQKGNKFIVLDGDIDDVPDGYMLVNLPFKGQNYRTLVPQTLMFYFANPGEGDIDDALEEIADFYGCVEDEEDESIGNGHTSVQEADWATIAKDRYKIYLINKLCRHKLGKYDDEGEPAPEFNERTLDELSLNDRYVDQRARGIAAICTGKSVEEMKKAKLTDLLKHVTVRERSERELTKEEFAKVACYSGSHYELKPEYQGDNDGVKYEISSRWCSRGEGRGKVITENKEIAVFDARIKSLEDEIKAYRQQKGDNIGRHDDQLVRQYINMAYIAKDNPKAQLEITPPNGNASKKAGD